MGQYGDDNYRCYVHTPHGVFCTHARIAMIHEQPFIARCSVVMNNGCVPDVVMWGGGRVRTGNGVVRLSRGVGGRWNVIVGRNRYGDMLPIGRSWYRTGVRCVVVGWSSGHSRYGTAFPRCSILSWFPGLLDFSELPLLVGLSLSYSALRTRYITCYGQFG